MKPKKHRFFSLLCFFGYHSPLRKVKKAFIDNVNAQVYVWKCACGRKWLAMDKHALFKERVFLF